MKNKFENQENGSMLGTTIQQVRKAKGITQEDLGKRVGLPKSSISKIEKGLTHISFEDASLLMDAMGEKISIQVMGMKEPDEKRVERVRFVTIGVMWYAHNKKMTFADAYRYLLTEGAGRASGAVRLCTERDSRQRGTISENDDTERLQNHCNRGW